MMDGINLSGFGASSDKESDFNVNSWRMGEKSRTNEKNRDNLGNKGWLYYSFTSSCRGGWNSLPSQVTYPPKKAPVR